MTLYDDINKHDEAIIFHHKARAYYEKLNDHYLRGAVYNNLGNSYFSLNRFDSAEYYYLRSIGMQQEANDDYGLSIAYSGYATLLDTLGKQRWHWVWQKTSPSKQTERSLSQAILLINMAGIYKLHAPEELDCLNRAKEIAEKTTLKKGIDECLPEIVGLYEKKKWRACRWTILKNTNAYKDSVFNETSNRQIPNEHQIRNRKKELKLKEERIRWLPEEHDAPDHCSVPSSFWSSWVSSCIKRTSSRKQKLQQEILKQQELGGAILSAEENERRRIAAELHDGIGQMMSAARMNLSVFEQELPLTAKHKKIFR